MSEYSRLFPKEDLNLICIITVCGATDPTTEKQLPSYNGDGHETIMPLIPSVLVRGTVAVGEYTTSRIFPLTRYVTKTPSSF
ncbi:MAG: hypothetical protein UV25_C0010G0023 [candidate division WWE3 bacterium GW2011_GWB1_42_41]|nr:MAG: hypothetical protein UV25_C0010G0023 [candidate division WWE3 bacterium GW2011_GWB1_42_41]